MADTYEPSPRACNPPLVAWQKPSRRRSNNPQFSPWNGLRRISLRLTRNPRSESRMTDQKQERHPEDEKIPPPTLSGEPERELELKLKKHPEDLDAKAD